jgi:ASC-1-like (ASCH) protein
MHGGKNKPGELYLGEVWFNEVKNGNKTVDIRAGNSSGLLEFEGKNITFFHKKDTIVAKCTKIVKYSSLDDFIKNEDALAVSPHLKTKKDAEKNLKEYYTDEKIKDMGGLLAIHFKTK